jgi:hypothetical protein
MEGMTLLKYVLQDVMSDALLVNSGSTKSRSSTSSLKEENQV